MYAKIHHHHHRAHSAAMRGTELLVFPGFVLQYIKKSEVRKSYPIYIYVWNTVATLGILYVVKKWN